ncbi:Tensin 1 [Perkinsus olseni]|uniref:Tensin 1 n=1 Tax=Perkinsus olseni TaxID=32597 RepID=A0A7J6MAT3_PEROL|nr:Tensin 1 [Perkinsus olseni]
MSGPDDAPTDGRGWDALWKSGQGLAAALQSQSQEVAAKIQVQAHDLAHQVSSTEWGGRVTTVVQQAAETLHRDYRKAAAAALPTEKPPKRNAVIKLAPRVFIIPFPEKNRASSIAAALPDNCKIFNMSERKYDPSEMFPSLSISVVDIVFPGLPYPSLVKTAEICLQVEEWLNGDPTRCVALHCIPSGLPTRTAVVSACLLFWLYPAEYSHPLDAVPRACKCLPLKEDDLLPSQRRYLSYFYRCICSRRSSSGSSDDSSDSTVEGNYLTPLPVSMKIVQVIVKANDDCDSDSTPLANPTSKVGWRPYLDLWQQGRKLYSSWEAIGDDSAPAKKSRADEPVLTFTIPNGGIPISEDVILRLRTYPGPHTVFRVPLPCPGVLYHDQTKRILLTRADLDGGVLSEFVDDVEVVFSFDDTQVDEDNPAIRNARQVLVDCRAKFKRHYTEDITKGGRRSISSSRSSKGNGGSRSSRKKEGKSSGDTPKRRTKRSEKLPKVTEAVNSTTAIQKEEKAAGFVTTGTVPSSNTGVKEISIPIEAAVGDAELGLDDLYGLTAVDDVWGDAAIQQNGDSLGEETIVLPSKEEEDRRSDPSSIPSLFGKKDAG